MHTEILVHILLGFFPLFAGIIGIFVLFLRVIFKTNQLEIWASIHFLLSIAFFLFLYYQGGKMTTDPNFSLEEHRFWATTALGAAAVLFIFSAWLLWKNLKNPEKNPWGFLVVLVIAWIYTGLIFYTTFTAVKSSHKDFSNQTSILNDFQEDY